jgi:hypothetical protein
VTRVAELAVRHKAGLLQEQERAIKSECVRSPAARRLRAKASCIDLTQGMHVRQLL